MRTRPRTQHQFQEGTRFDSWMFRIVQTIWIDQVRSRDVRKEDGEIAEERLGSDEPVRRVEARLALAEVRRAVDRLPPDQRTALLLVTVEGLSYKEAAEVAGVPVGTIMSRLARARIALQLQLEAGGGMRRSTDECRSAVTTVSSPISTASSTTVGAARCRGVARQRSGGARQAGGARRIGDPGAPRL